MRWKQFSTSLVREAQVTFYLANGTQHEPKRDPGPEPAIFKNPTSALKVEHVGAVQLRTEQRVNTLKEEQFEVKLFHLMDRRTDLELPVLQEQQRAPL